MKAKDLKPDMVIDLLFPFETISAWTTVALSKNKFPEMCVSNHEDAKMLIIKGVIRINNYPLIRGKLHNCDKDHYIDGDSSFWKLNILETLKNMKRNL